MKFYCLFKLWFDDWRKFFPRKIWILSNVCLRGCQQLINLFLLFLIHSGKNESEQGFQIKESHVGENIADNQSKNDKSRDNFNGKKFVGELGSFSKFGDENIRGDNDDLRGRINVRFIELELSVSKFFNKRIGFSFLRIESHIHVDTSNSEERDQEIRDQGHHAIAPED